jgi:hypothetical protein
MAPKKVFVVNSPNVKYTNEFIEADYNYQITKVETNGDVLMVSSSLFSFSAYINDILIRILLNTDISVCLFRLGVK